jgi:hypothetical protein
VYLREKERKREREKERKREREKERKREREKERKRGREKWDLLHIVYGIKLKFITDIKVEILSISSVSCALSFHVKKDF